MAQVRTCTIDSNVERIYRRRRTLLYPKDYSGCEWWVAQFPFPCTTEQPTFDGDELMLEIVGKDLICRLSHNLCTANPVNFYSSPTFAYPQRHGRGCHSSLRDIFMLNWFRPSTDFTAFHFNRNPFCRGFSDGVIRWFCHSVVVMRWLRADWNDVIDKEERRW